MLRYPAALLAALTTGASLLAGSPSSAPRNPFQSDLDAFMQKVLARRDENWKKLQQYVLDEREQIEIRGPSNIPIWGERRDYTWYLRDGFFVRSPLKVNGVAVPEPDRREYEGSYLKRVKERDKRRGRGTGTAGAPATPGTPGTPEPPTSVESLIAQTRQPEFIDSAYFLKFKFEEGTYALVGRETFDGREVLRIEYYPARLFSHEQDKELRQRQGRGERGGAAPGNRSQEVEATFERMMNKVALVTIWVEPKSFQIVKYTFDNVNFDFLPVAWLLHVDDLKAAMTMSQPLPDVWLPRDVDLHLSAMMAIGSFGAHYHLDYRDYRKAETSSRIKIGGGGE